MAKRYDILYVDDEQDNLMAFKAVFRRSFNVYTALSGKEAIALLKTQRVDLILSDQRMPEMTGLEFFECIKQEYPQIVRMVVTGYSEMGPIHTALERGNINHYLTKPWDVDQLKETIEEALTTSSH
ncbi:MAG: response regulator [Bacteroidota bacterium]